MKVFQYLLSTSASKMVRIGGLALLCAALASPAFAGGFDQHFCADGGGAPEIDPNCLAGALTLLSGGVLVLCDRFRRK
jgi:hypothetical protein